MSALKRYFGLHFINKSVFLAKSYGTIEKITPADIDERVLGIIKAFDKVDPSKVSLESDLQKDLGLDSLDRVEVMVALEEEFGLEIPEEIAESANNLNDFASYFKKDQAH